MAGCKNFWDTFLLICILYPYVIWEQIKDLINFLKPSHWKHQKLIVGQKVLITGAGSGIGRELAVQISKHSVCLVLLDLNHDGLAETENLLDKRSTAFLYTCDVADRNAVYETAELIRKDVGRVDILVNNAGIVSGKNFMDIPDKTILKVFEVNALAHFWMCKAFLPEMIESGRGHIVSVASLAGLTGFPFLTDYCASKYAAVGLMESLKLELAAKKVDGVKLTLVCPGLVSTGLFEGAKPALTPTMTPDYVARKMMDAILEEKEVLLLPGWSVILIIFRWMMPQKAVDKFYQNSGLLEFMNSFKGRTDNNNVPHIKAS